MTKKAEWRLLALITLGAFALRVVLLFAFQAHIFRTDWNFGYETGRIARALAEGEGFSSPFREPSGPTAWLMPAYPALLALIFLLFGTYSEASAVAILILNSFFGALTCIAVYLLAKPVLGRRTALVAGAGLAIYPPSIWHSITTVWDTSLLALVVVLLVCGIYALDGKNRLGAAGLYGLALGLAAWVNPIVLCLLPVVWLWIWRRYRDSASRRLGAAALATLAVVIVIIPWLVRNQQQFGRPYLRSNLGMELKLGNSDDAWQAFLAGSMGSPWLRGHPSAVKKDFERYVSMGEAAFVQEAQEEALAFIREHPVKFLRLSLQRLYIFWLSDLVARNDSVGNLKVTTSLSWMRKACHLVPLPFLILGLVVAARKRLDIGPMIGLIILFPIVYYVTHVSERYRFPLEPVLVILASYGLVWLFERLNLWANIR